MLVGNINPLRQEKRKKEKIQLELCSNPWNVLKTRMCHERLTIIDHKLKAIIIFFFFKNKHRCYWSGNDKWNKFSIFKKKTK
jgi:hypothetical protein